jgi:hypothetical protein
MDELNRWARAHPDVAVVAIHRGGPVDEVGAFIAAKKWTGPVFLVDDLDLAAAAYRVDSVPAYFVIGPDGLIRAVRFGVPPRGWLDKQARTK